MTDVFKCKKSGTTCCAPKSRIHEVQMMHRNDTYPQFVGLQQQQQIPQYLPNNYQQPQNYQQIPPNNYAPIPNPYQPIAAQPINNNYHPISSQNNYNSQPQSVPQQPIQQAPIISNNYPVPAQNYPNSNLNANVYQPNVVIGNSGVNLSPAYSTPGMSTLLIFPTSLAVSTEKSTFFFWLVRHFGRIKINQPNDYQH